MATLFVDKIDPQSGTSLEIGSSGDTVSFASGVTGPNYPAFHVNSNGQGSSIDIPNATVTKVILTNEMIDTDSAYDTSNGRFTPQIAGKYFVYSAITYEKTGDFDNIQLRIRKMILLVLQKL